MNPPKAFASACKVQAWTRGRH